MVDVLISGSGQTVYYLARSRGIAEWMMKMAIAWSAIEERGLRCSVIKHDRRIEVPFVRGVFQFVAVEQVRNCLEGCRAPLGVDHYAWDTIDEDMRQWLRYGCPLLLDTYGLEGL